MNFWIPQVKKCKKQYYTSEIVIKNINLPSLMPVKPLFFLFACLSMVFLSCKKDKTLTDPSAKVSFSQDSVLFDTVFTTIGSTTRAIRVINKNNQKINISSVSLEQGNASNFFLNVDGVKGRQVNGVEILANDSIYIFIQVNVNPTSQNTPLVIQDKILFNVNGNIQSVALEAWGQDAYYHFPDRAIQYKTGFLPYSLLSSSTNTTVTWSNDKPHVIYGWLVVDSTQKLVINQGVKVYMHKGAGLWVYRFGCLQVNGVAGNEVVFQGDRREGDYSDQPGQWDRIWINEGRLDNHINYAIIKNSYIGLQTEVIATTQQPGRLKLTNTAIKNCSKWGLYAVAYNIWGANNTISNCKEYVAALTVGGKYTFLHSTFANYFDKEGGRGGQVCVHIDNYTGSTPNNLDSAYFGNCIIDGSQANELELDMKAGANARYEFDNSLLKTAVIAATNSTNNVFNKASDFRSVSNYDFRLNSGSKARGIGDPAILLINPAVLNTDLKGDSRTSGAVDAGANQYTP